MASQNKIIIEGIPDFAALPPAIHAEAASFTREGAEQARDRIRAAYPYVTGRLQAGVKAVKGQSATGVTQYLVLSTTKYALPYEFGSHHQRARPTFYPIARQEQTLTTRAIIALVRAAGFTVTGDDV